MEGDHGEAAELEEVSVEKGLDPFKMVSFALWSVRELKGQSSLIEIT